MWAVGPYKPISQAKRVFSIHSRIIFSFSLALSSSIIELLSLFACSLRIPKSLDRSISLAVQWRPPSSNHFLLLTVVLSAPSLLRHAPLFPKSRPLSMSGVRGFCRRSLDWGFQDVLLGFWQRQWAGELVVVVQ